MKQRVVIHPTVKTAAYALGCSFAVIFLLSLVKKLTRDDPPASNSGKGPTTQAVAAPEPIYLPALSNNLLLPVLELDVADASLESSWSAALAQRLHGRTEAPVEGGRVDVLTDDYAIEVDRLEKWHEGIGQAAHYGMLTKAMPVVALIVPSDNWPMNANTRTRLFLVDRTCTTQNVKLILLRRAGQRNVVGQ